MLFTPKKRGRDWYWFQMVLLYLFAFAFGVGAVGSLLSTDVDLSERIVLASIFSLIALTMWAFGRKCSTIVAQLGADDQGR